MFERAEPTERQFDGSLVLDFRRRGLALKMVSRGDGFHLPTRYPASLQTHQGVPFPLIENAVGLFDDAEPVSPVEITVIRSIAS